MSPITPTTEGDAMTTIEIQPLSIDQRIEQRANELCPTWQRRHASSLATWALDAARREVMRASCDYGHCHDAAECFEQTIVNGIIVETRPFCAEHALRSMELRAYAAKLKDASA